MHKSLHARRASCSQSTASAPLPVRGSESELGRRDASASKTEMQPPVKSVNQWYLTRIPRDRGAAQPVAFQAKSHRIVVFRSLIQRPLGTEIVMATGMDEQFASLMSRGEKELDELKSNYANKLAEVELLHRKEMQDLNENLKIRMEGEVSKVKVQAAGVTVAVASAAVIAILTFMYGGVKDAYSGMKDVNQSVIALQDNLMKAQGAIKIATAELDAAKNNGQQLIRDSVAALQTAQQNLATTQTAYEGRSTAIQAALQALATTQTAYEGRSKAALQALATTQTAYEARITAVQAAQQTLATTQTAYEGRLQELRGTQVRQ
jgi:hypothetical protein